MLKTWSPNVLSTRFFMFFLSCSSSSQQSTFTSQPTPDTPPSGCPGAPRQSPQQKQPRKSPRQGRPHSAGTEGACKTWLEVAPDQNRRRPQPPPTTAPADRGKNHRGFQGETNLTSFLIAGVRERQASPNTPPDLLLTIRPRLSLGDHHRLAVETRRTGNAPPGRSAETTCESPTD